MMTKDEVIRSLNYIGIQSLKNKPRKGKWIQNDYYKDALMCSCCKAYLDKEDWSRHYFYYCYHCGAEMEKMDDGEETANE